MRFNFLLFLLACSSVYAQPQNLKADITVDLSSEIGSFSRAWAWFGYDEPNYTYMKDGKKLLSDLAALSPVPVYVRTHNLLTSGDGTPALKWGSTNVYSEDANGNPVYNWQIIDRIFDTWIERGMKPLVELGFMPEALSSKPQPYRHFWKPGDPYDDIYTGWSFPPEDYGKWSALIYNLVTHFVEKYGEAEAGTWLWELWNEPDIKYWGGTFDEYCKLYDYTADAVKRALPSARIGGPHTTNPGSRNAGQFLEKFLNHCDTGINYATGGRGAPLDFVAFHAKGAPVFRDGVVRMNMGVQLRNVSRGFEIVASHPRFSMLPVIIGECDPEGCAACGMDVYPQNGYRNGTMYSVYTASSFAKIFDLAIHHNMNLTGIVSWSFEFEDQPWFHGFRDLSTNGVGKPVLNVFRMFGMMDGTRVAAHSNLGSGYESIIESGVRGDVPDIGVLASKREKSAFVMIWNYHDDDVKAPGTPFEILIKPVPSAKVTVREYRIDSEHGNSFEAWKKMGSPPDPSPRQIRMLEEAATLKPAAKPQKLKAESGKVLVSGSIQRQGVSLFEIKW